MISVHVWSLFRMFTSSVVWVVYVYMYACVYTLQCPRRSGLLLTTILNQQSVVLY